MQKLRALYADHSASPVSISTNQGHITPNTPYQTPPPPQYSLRSRGSQSHPITPVPAPFLPQIGPPNANQTSFRDLGQRYVLVFLHVWFICICILCAYLFICVCILCAYMYFTILCVSFDPVRSVITPLPSITPPVGPFESHWSQSQTISSSLLHITPPSINQATRQVAPPLRLQTKATNDNNLSFPPPPNFVIPSINDRTKIAPSNSLVC